MTMKDKIKKQVRLQALVMMSVIALVLVMCDHESGAPYLYYIISKASALILMITVRLLYKRWEKCDKLPQIEEI